MMFGWRHPFHYAQCLQCGTLQIVEIPKNLSDYYPADYYSLTKESGLGQHASLSRRLLARFLLLAPGVSWITRRLSLRYPFFNWARLARARPDSAILDVGCGSGRLLRRMQRYGFSHLCGVDPYAPSKVDEPGFRIYQTELSNVTGKFDLIIMSHVLEHLIDPVATLRTARELLNPGGVILVRTPVAGSKLAEEYGPNWFNLDPPRHLFIPSVEGARLIAEQASLEIERVEFDSIEESAWMSENYAKGISMQKASKPPRAERNRLRRAAQILNQEGRGDLAAYYLAASNVRD
jgi:SAM-dependent methyltransferase